MSLRASLGSRGCFEATELRASRRPRWRGVSERSVAAVSSFEAFEVLWDEDRPSWVSEAGGMVVPFDVQGFTALVHLREPFASFKFLRGNFRARDDHFHGTPAARERTRRPAKRAARPLPEITSAIAPVRFNWPGAWRDGKLAEKDLKLVDLRRRRCPEIPRDVRNPLVLVKIR
ncbi:hypothetical protein MTO96_045871 [Rhipicephalus appendiculatus]